jgi:hypothetical protein
LREVARDVAARRGGVEQAGHAGLDVVGVAHGGGGAGGEPVTQRRIGAEDLDEQAVQLLASHAVQPDFDQVVGLRGLRELAGHVAQVEQRQRDGDAVLAEVAVRSVRAVAPSGQARASGERHRVRGGAEHGGGRLAGNEPEIGDSVQVVQPALIRTRCRDPANVAISERKFIHGHPLYAVRRARMRPPS